VGGGGGGGWGGSGGGGGVLWFLRWGSGLVGSKRVGAALSCIMRCRRRFERCSMQNVKFLFGFFSGMR